MKRFNKAISIILSLIIFISSTVVVYDNAKAATASNSFSATYTGNYDANEPLVFSIFSVNTVDNTFTGNIKIDAKDVLVSINKNITGTIAFYPTYYVCSFSFKYNWLFTSYDAAFNITVYPDEGRAVGYGGGGMLIYSAEFTLIGTVNWQYNKYTSYNTDDMKLCIFLSNRMYGTEKMDDDTKIIASLLKDEGIFRFAGFEKNNVILKNISDTNPDNVSFALLTRESKTSINEIDIIVVIRGTLWEEWRGNVQITGDEYNESLTTHENFEKAKESMKEDIQNYYNEYAQGYDRVNLIVTGHSRGAAVANLYAKDATDATNGKTGLNIPKFDTVTAYTFACPNVAKYNDKMSDYNNIYNYCFTTDIVPLVPLVNPTDGWNYWKYGKNYSMDINSVNNSSQRIGSSDIKRYKFDDEITEKLSTAFSQWKTVEEYYNKEFPTTIDENNTIYTTLYEFLYDITYMNGKAKYKKLAIIPAISYITNTPRLAPLVSFAIDEFPTIFMSHHYFTYNLYINGDDDTPAYGDTEFMPITYNDVTGNLSTYTADTDIAVQADDTTDDTVIEYNSNEVAKLKAIANYGNNNDTLQWNLEDPSTWTGVTWNAEGHATKIDFVYKWLEGEADFSGFSALTSLNLYANSFTSINLSECGSISYLDCDYNNLSSGGLDLSACTGLTKLYCNGCSLSAIDLSQLTELQTLSCSFNDLIALNLEANTKLKNISCVYNYLDVHEGGTLYTQLNNYKSSNKAYINYYEQKLPTNAVLDTDELQALESFAKYNNNNSALDWLDDNGDLSLEKIQNNVMFAFDGEKYRAVTIELGGFDVEGTLNLAAFTQLNGLSCGDTKITGLVLSGCGNIQELYCENAQLSSLTLPSNLGTDSSQLDTLECENNHLDINIFTTDIIEQIKSKPNYTLKYRHQIINGGVQAFDENEYNALYNFANQPSNQDTLNWDLEKPGQWDEINWILDTETGKYKLLDLNIAFADVKGNLNLSYCTRAEELQFSHSHINTVTLPENGMGNYKFNDCKQLEAVIINGGTEIKDEVFMNCPALQAVYIPDSVVSISDSAFTNSPKVAIAGTTGAQAETFANEKNIPFKPGAFLCGNIITRETAKDENLHRYSISGAEIKADETTAATTDEYGYFVAFSLDNGEHSYNVDYIYGFKRPVEITVSSKPIICERAISIVNGDWVRDGNINGKDFAMFQSAKKGQATAVEQKYFDINNDGEITNADWSIVSKLASYTEQEEAAKIFNVN